MLRSKDHSDFRNIFFPGKIRFQGADSQLLECKMNLTTLYNEQMIRSDVSATTRGVIFQVSAPQPSVAPVQGVPNNKIEDQSGHGAGDCTPSLLLVRFAHSTTSPACREAGMIGISTDARRRSACLVVFDCGLDCN